MDELLQLISNRLGVPTDLLERAAAARAAASGSGAEDIVRSWAGDEAPLPAAAAPPPQPAPAAPVAAESAPAPPPPAPPAATEAESPAVEVLLPAEPAAGDSDDGGEDEAVQPAAAGDRSTVLSGFPRWLAASFVLLPLAALLYALVTPNAPDCGSAGQLAVDPVTGVAVNCDGSPYGVDAVDFFAIGEEVYSGKCAACHGAAGGGGVGPAFTGGAVLATFPACGEHITWVEIGSIGWPDPTYGANNTPVLGSGAVMPGFAAPVLTAEELASVVLYERVAFGGEALPEAEGGCGLTGGTVVAAP